MHIYNYAAWMHLYCCSSFSKWNDNKYVIHTNYTGLYTSHVFLAISILWKSNLYIYIDICAWGLGLVVAWAMLSY